MFMCSVGRGICEQTLSGTRAGGARVERRVHVFKKCRDRQGETQKLPPRAGRAQKDEHRYVFALFAQIQCVSFMNNKHWPFQACSLQPLSHMEERWEKSSVGKPRTDHTCVVPACSCHPLYYYRCSVVRSSCYQHDLSIVNIYSRFAAPS